MTRFAARCVCLSVILLSSSLFAAEEPLRTAGNRTVDIEHIKLDLDVNLKAKSIEGSATIDFTPLQRVKSLALDAVGFDVAGIELVTKTLSRKLAFQNTGEKLRITFPDSLPIGTSRRIVVHYRVKKPRAGLHFFAPTKERPQTPTMVWSQGEPISSRHWFPSLDQPNERQSTEIIATIPAGFEAISNGKLVSKTKVDNGRRVRVHWKQEKPHVSYLVSLVVGQFAVHRDTWRGRPVTYYAPLDRAADVKRTFGRTPEMLDFFSKRFGIQYPWAEYAQVVVEQFTSGGMENTGATTLYDRVMHDRRAMLDSSPDRLIAHELGHQWWGDLVTCKDWAHLWLNEGFATYCEVLWYEHKLGKDERDYLLFAKSRSARSGGALKRPIVDRRYSHPRTMFDSRAYPKGGWVLHMLRNRLGDDAFFQALQRYGTAYAYQTAETSDLRKVFERLTGESLERFFFDWTERAGHPKLKITSKYEPASKSMRIDITQTQTGDAFHFPLTISLAMPGKRPPVLVESMVTEKSRTIYVPVSVRPTMVRVDPQLTLLAEIQETKSLDWWKAQLRNAPTVAERLRAVAHFAGKRSDAERQLLIATLNTDPFYGVRIEAAAALGKSRGDLSRAALVAGIAQPHPKVRTACIKALGSLGKNASVLKSLKDKWRRGDASYKVEAAVIGALASVGETVDSAVLAEAIKRNSHGDVIRMAALNAYAKTNDPKSVQVLLSWTGESRTRRTRMAALGALPKFFTANKVSDATTKTVLGKLETIVRTGRPRIRRAAADSLRGFGTKAQPSKAVLESVVANDSDFRVRKAATDALAKISPTSADASKKTAAELKSLRETVKQLKKENQSLETRLKRIEAALKKRSAP